MKILLIDQYGELGGGQRCLIEASAGFAARGWELHAAIPAGGPLASKLALYCSGVYPISCGPFSSTTKTFSDAVRFAGQLPGQTAALRQIVREADIDVLYVNGPRLLPAAALARRSRPLLFHTHWDVPQRMVARLMRWSSRNEDTSVVASSESSARAFAGTIPRERMRVIYNGIAGFGALPRPRERVRHVAVLGRIAPEKGQLEFVRAARIASAANADLGFSVCGAPLFGDSRYLARVREEARGLPVAFPGWTDDIGTWLRDVDLLVVPSDASDNVPRVILEAYAAGVAVVAFASGGIPELIDHGVTGWLVDRRTPADLAAAILNCASDVSRLNAIAVRGYERWRERYTLDRFQSELCTAVERAVLRDHQRTPLTTASADPAA